MVVAADILKAGILIVDDQEPNILLLEQMLRGAELRVTRPRVAVLNAVFDHPHADTDSITGIVRDEIGNPNSMSDGGTPTSPFSASRVVVTVT